MSRLVVNQVHNRYLQAPISLTVEAAQIVCLIGQSGAGKSRLLRAIADLDDHEGEILLDGVAQNQYSPSEWRKRVALLSGESQWWHSVIGEHFLAVDEEKLALLNLSLDAMTWQVNRPSTGEKQRLALLRALANSPKALLLDEPTANLDSENAQRVERLIQAYCVNASASVLWVSHDTAQIERVSQRHFKLEHGKIFEER
jgi:ABC-type iron transport system FetAB ATPase subunit